MHYITFSINSNGLSSPLFLSLKREEEDVDGSDGTGNNIGLEGVGVGVGVGVGAAEVEGEDKGEGGGETALTEIPIIPSSDSSIRLPSYFLSETNRGDRKSVG